MANQAEQEENHPESPSSHTETPPSSPESSLSWCLVQLSKSTPSPGADSKHSREADKRLKAWQWRALVAIRTHHIKGGNSKIVRYQAQGGLLPLLAILRRPESSRKVLDLTLSILANCCTEKETRAELWYETVVCDAFTTCQKILNKVVKFKEIASRPVRKLDGVSVVVEVLKRHASVETVENRAARALGNLAMDPEGSARVHSAGGVPPLLLCLSPSTSPSSPSSPSALPPSPPPSCSKLEGVQSAARALFYLSDTPSHRLSLLSQGALSALALFVAPEYPPALRRASLRAVHELTRGCGAECAREVSASGMLSQLGLLASEEDDGPLQELTLKTLANLCSQACLRPLVGSLGVIQKFAKEVKKDPLKSGVLFKALCLCCKEAVNRVKVKESRGLEALTGVLGAHRDHPLTRLAILACVDFVYDEAALEQLQELGLVPLLATRLVDLARGDELEAEAGLTPGAHCSEMMASCFDSFDFPPPEGSRREEAGKEQGSSSFLSLRSWLLSEGLISSEGDLMESPCGMDGDLGSPNPSCSPSSSSSSSSSPPLPALSEVSSSSPAPSKPISSPSPRPKPCRLSSSAPPAPVTPTCPASPSALLPSCTSTPQPKPPAAPVSPFKASSPPRKRLRTTSSSSCSSHLSLLSLDAPPVMPKTPAYQHPYHPEPWAPESPVLLLLSRFSHATDPSGALVTAPVLSALLYYLTQHREPSGRCCRMLTRISCNLNCLQALVRTGAVALIRHRLCLGEEDRGSKERQSDRVKAKIRQLGQGLLSNVRVQSETGFGSGVLTHIVLSGSESDRLYCVLSLPLITSNRVLLKKLLLDSGGLLSALEPLVCLDAPDEENADKCRTLLSPWLRPPEQASVSRLRSLYASLLIGCLSCLLASSKVEPDRPIRSDTESNPLYSSPCPYDASAHDLHFLLDDGTTLLGSREAVVGEVDAESEYFRALLTGGFDEARQSARDAIRIRDVTRAALLPVLHYLHGCRMDCSGDAGRCPVLSSVACGGLGGDGFERSPLGELMIGASRFLVSGLQKTAEDVCMSHLSSLTSKADPGAQRRGSGLISAQEPQKEDETGAEASLLPQVYWFSQRYSYPRLGLACLSVLLRPQEARFAPLPPSVSADCLVRLVREADGAENLRKDLLSLAAAALS